MPDNYEYNLEIDKLIHEPARLSILALLSAVECADFTFLLRETELTRGNLSSHLSKLEEAAYISVQREIIGKIPRTTCRLTDTGRLVLKQYKRQMQQLLRRLP
ncbi:MAG: transcriptional regulator [Bacillota bacterium]|nr:transcriptional regulator [Bacillota bacterium]